MTDATFTLLESKVWFENSANEWENYWILFIITQIKKPRLCSHRLKKHLAEEHSRSRENTRLCLRYFTLHFFYALPLPKCYTTEQSTVEASLFVK